MSPPTPALSRRAADVRVALAAAALSAVLLTLSVTGPGWLAWLALVPAATVALAAPASRAGRLAVPLAYALYLEALVVPALPFGIAEGQWGDPLVPMVGDSPVLVVALVLIPLAGVLLYGLRFGSPAGAGPQPWQHPWVALAVPVVAWTALDLLRVRVDPGGLWGPLFASQHDTAAAGLAAPAGPLLLTAAIVAVNYAIALAIVSWRSAVRPLAATAAALAAVAVAGTVLAPGEDRSVRVAAVQPGYDTAEDGLPVLRWFSTDRHDLASLDLVADLEPLTLQAAQRGAQLVAWPEATVWAHRHPAVRRELAAVARRAGVTLVVPWFDPRHDHGGTVVVSPRGAFSAEQPKQRPMWFLGERDTNRVPPRPVAVGAVTVGTLLGVDNQDPSLPRRLADRGATVLVSATHDWEQLAARQRAFAQLHAVGAHTPLVRSDWRYGSAIFDAEGRRVADAGSAKRRVVLVADVALPAAGRRVAGPGDLPGWLLVGAAVAVLGLPRAAGGLRRERRAV